MSIKHIINSEIKDLNLDLIIEGLNEVLNGNISKGNFTTVLSENDKVQGLDEDLNKISLQNATDRKMFGPVYHGTTTENRENIEREGFKIFVGTDRGENIRHGYPGQRAYAHDIPPPIHHLGYGIYFTTVKTIAKRFNVDSAKGLKTYYLDVPRLATINFASPNKMMDWWLANGYNGELAKSGQEGRVEATKNMTETLKKNYDAIWFKGKTIYKVLDGDQVVVFDTNNIYQIDSSLAGELEIGSKVRRTEDRFDYRYSYSTISGESKTLKTIPTIAKGTVGVIVDKKPVEPMLNQWHNVVGRTEPHWAEGSDYVYVVKWNKGGTESNILDKYITPYNVTNKQVAEIVNEELENLSEDGDVVVDIVNDELNKNNCTLEEDNNVENNINNKADIISEGLSDILYHYTYTSSLLSILKYNKFATSSNLGSNADSWKDKGRFYFFSTQRTKGMSGYAQHHGNVAIVLDGRKLNYTFKGSPTDYWNWSKKRSDYKNIGDYTQALQSEENEDRIVTNKPYIDNANQYIIEIHILISENEDKDRIDEINTLCQGYSISVFFYTDENSFKLQDKRKAVGLESLNLQPREKSAYDEKEGERDLYNAKWFFKKIAPPIIAGNDNNEMNNNERDIIEKLLKQLLEKGGQADQYDNVMQDINDKVKRLSTSWGRMYADDEFATMQAEIHNHRGDPNPYLRELLKLLINDMKKWGVKNLKEYFNKKFKAGIK
jgi:hypothetical protein